MLADLEPARHSIAALTVLRFDFGRHPSTRDEDDALVVARFRWRQAIPGRTAPHSGLNTSSQDARDDSRDESAFDNTGIIPWGRWKQKPLPLAIFPPPPCLEIRVLLHYLTINQSLC